MVDNIKKSVGERVREERKRAGFKAAEDLAAALEMSASSVYQLERGENWLSPEMLVALSRVLKVPPAAFFPGYSESAGQAGVDAIKALARIRSEMDSLDVLLKDVPNMKAESAAEEAAYKAKIAKLKASSQPRPTGPAAEIGDLLATVDQSKHAGILAMVRLTVESIRETDASDELERRKKS